MKKIMFNDKYDLTDAVLQGRKTMTRRMVGNRMTDDDIRAYLKGYTELADKTAPYKIGEVVAVAQSYSSFRPLISLNDDYSPSHPGWSNKMFVRADLMPHQIRIINFKVERLQDISEDDCLKEGLIKKPHPFVREAGWVYCMPNDSMDYVYPTQCFADLIDKISGKGTWGLNPFVFAYSFKLIK